MTEEEDLIDEAAERLKRTVREGRSVDAAQVKVIGLDEVREAAGAEWPRMKSRIHSNAMNFLQGCLTANDLVIPCGDGFLIVYASGDTRDVDSSCRQITDALNGFFLGEEGLQRLRAKVTPQQMSADALVAAATWTAGNRKREPLFLRFLPIWSAAGEAIACYWLTPVVGISEPAAIYNPSYRARGRHSDCDFFDLDLKILDAAIAMARDAAAEGAGFNVAFSVHTTTLLSGTNRRLYRDKLASAPDALRRRLIAKIAEIEPGTPIISMVDWVSLLHGRVDRVVLELHPSERSFDGFESARACAAGFALPVRDDKSRMTEYSESSKLMARWRAVLRRKGMNMFVDNLVDRPDVEAALVHRIDWLSGARLWSPLERPRAALAEGRGSVLRRSSPVARR